MLRPEAARKRLEQFRDRQATANRRLRVQALPESVQGLAWACLGRDDGRRIGNWKRQEAVATDAVQRLAALSAGERAAVWSALFPALAPALEAAWRGFEVRPYQTDYGLLPFWAPVRLELLREARRQLLDSLYDLLEDYDPSAEWVAEWASYLGGYDQSLGYLLAGVLDIGQAEAERIFEILTLTAAGEHPTAAMGRHVTTALLCASRPDGWEYVGRLLVAAQRQEGLRQVILESVDEAHPGAYRHLLRVMVDQDLLRFSAALRAFDVWLGVALEAAENGKEARRMAGRILAFLDDPAERLRASTSGDARELYLALWTLAFEDTAGVFEAIDRCGLLQDTDADRRFATAYLLARLQHPGATPLLLELLADEDLGVALTASAGLDEPDEYHYDPRRKQSSSIPEQALADLERLALRSPKSAELPARLWPGTEVQAKRADVLQRYLRFLPLDALDRILPHLRDLEPWPRARLAETLAGVRKLSEQGRLSLFTLLGDASEDVRDSALKGIRKLKLRESEVGSVEALLTRKAASLRRAALELLAGQADEPALASARRLLRGKTEPQRLAGLDLLRELTSAGRAVEQCRAAAREFAAARTPTEAEARALEALARPAAEQPAEWTLVDALGLMDPAGRTPPAHPRALAVETNTPAAHALLRSLDRLIHEHREASVRIVTFVEEEEAEDEAPDAAGTGETRVVRETLLGNLEYGFPSPGPRLPIEKDLLRLPLAELWLTWFQQRPSECRDSDECELFRASLLVRNGKLVRSAYRSIAGDVLDWLRRLRGASASGVADARMRGLIAGLTPPGSVDVAAFLLDGWESALIAVSAADFQAVRKGGWGTTRKSVEYASTWLELLESHRPAHPGEWTDAHYDRYWRLHRYHDEPPGVALRERPDSEVILECFRRGIATPDDLLDHLLGPRDDEDSGYGFDLLGQVTARGRRGVPVDARLQEIVARCRARILEVELRRGEMPTPATGAAMALRTSGGVATMLSALGALGQRSFPRGWIADRQQPASVLSHFIRTSHPEPDETPEAVAGRLREARVPATRLVELACYAPQWAAHVEAALDWPGLEDAVWWFHAHTKDVQWTVDQELRDSWASRVSERTPLSAGELEAGAVDVEWFRRIHGRLTPDRWKVLSGAAKFASGGEGYRRAQLYAEALLGVLSPESLGQRIREKRHQDSVRALGLVPLPEEPAARDQELMARYVLLQEFARGSRQFGAMRQQNEQAAVRTALENLAHAAGYADSGRLIWALEARLGEGLGDQVAEAAGVRVELQTNLLGDPELRVSRGDRVLKSIPPAVKKDPGVAALVARRAELLRQASRMRSSLEAAMCRGDRFQARELTGLLRHPVLAPFLRNLVLLGISEAGEATGVAGYPDERMDVLFGPRGQEHTVRPEDWFRIAHPHDLHATGRWHEWQADCFRRERVQPFKQVFRELYVLTAGEQTEGGFRSVRYAGHQVHPKQSQALLARRGWVGDPEEGTLTRTFHTDGIVACLFSDDGWSTPAEVEGLTIDCVGFLGRSNHRPLPLDRVPPLVFSETMRDVDLVVSVAHQGGVDPEASQSTVEMRRTLLQETLALMRLDNVRLEGSHALIEGSLATYNVHLGSAVVHRQPGGHLCIVPVHSQHRGRLFLPFADNDPRTAEVVSKVLLLARDSEIRDPTILEQILPHPG